MQAKRATQPPGSADFSALVKKVNELAAKTPGVKPLSELVSGRIPAWKRWVGGESEFDASGLRDVVDTNALFLNAVKGDVDAHGQAILDLQADVKALQEAPPARPFP